MSCWRPTVTSFPRLSGSDAFITDRRFPRGLGHDFAGIVQVVGDGVTRLSLCDEVLATTTSLR